MFSMCNNSKVAIVLALFLSGSINAVDQLRCGACGEVGRLVFDSAGDKLFNAICKGDAEAVEHLLEEGVNKESRYKGITPLLAAVFRGQVEVVKVLLTAKVNVNAGDEDGFTPLLVAAQWGLRK